MRAGQAGMPAVATGILACPQEGRRQPPALRIQALRPGSARQTWRGMEHRATALCSLLGRQECLPYLRPCACARRADPEEMEHRATALGVHGRPGGKWSTGLTGQCSLLGRQECLPYLRPCACARRADPEEMEHRAYRPMLSTGQARMPTLPKAGMPTLPACR